MEFCLQDTNLALREENVSLAYCSPAALRPKRNNRSTYYLRMNHSYRLNFENYF